ncbi:MAG: ferrochelatase [Kangiellaceae bacterium]|jgi:ferrochelatase|nr:ferrochelatase [Kangiellaceae bacterium]
MSSTHDYGVLLVNLGTPDEPTAEAVRKYLAEFLHDKRVVDLTRWIWCPVLHGIILRVRPPKVAKLYQSVWTEEGSPLMAISKQQRSGLAAVLEQKLGKPVPVVLGMNYGNPSLASAIEQLKDCKKVIVLPLYPQFSTATTASVYDRVAKVLKSDWNQSEYIQVRDYHNHDSYIEALANSVKQSWQQHGRNELLVMSFHGIPKRYADNGDPYPDECRETARLLAEKLELSEEQWMVTFQSRFGREEWLQPYTDKTMERLGAEHKSIDIICPGFSADCLETLEEIQEENHEIFEQHGGKGFNYIPCLNANSDHISMMADIISERIK